MPIMPIMPIMPTIRPIRSLPDGLVRRHLPEGIPPA